ncbi:DUF4157 domain-containing protein [Pseudanabaena sp. PCC 6802]|uniref:eCIS core domain-containing protein n=1 Tax=Pseudanabaena sp. PCC 6802 TaxID=118173 RepID=UPI0003449D06|nr:DUF4157 domain-containing protein [Pseudanabaena sp. PCC 6802]
METGQYKTINRASTVQKPAASLKSVQTVVPRGSVQLQSMKVSSPKDPAEKEADTTAKKIMRMAIPESSIAYVKTGSDGLFRQVKQEEKDKKVQTKLRSPYISRFADSGIFTQRKPEDIIQRKAEGQPNVASNVAADIQTSMASGSPLPLSVRQFMEPRFQANFSNVKIHTGDKSAKLNRQLNAQAFTVGNQIFFGKDKFQPEQSEGKELIAHELTHTIQQGAAIQRSEDVAIAQQSPTQVQRLGLSDALNYFADKANLIPGFRMFTIVLGVNPINMSSVDRSAANILRAIVEFIPGGGFITQALDNHGVFEKVGNWVEQQIQTLGLVGSVIKQAIAKFLDSLSWSDILDLGGVWERAKRIFTEPIDRIINFAKGLITGILKFVKDAILKPLAALAQGTRGYDLLKAILGEDPITGEPVPRNADTLIGGFMKLIGQEEVWENIKKGNAIARAWAWFQGALEGLMGFVRTVPRKIVDTITSLTIQDIVTVAGAFTKIVSAFVNIATDFISWGIKQVISLLEILFSVVAPGVMPYIKKAQAAFTTIIKNPIGFVGNLVRAGKLGFQKFADNILEHLKAALIKWITGPLGEAGVYIPQAFSLIEIVKLVLSVLGLTWQNIRSKLVKIIPEPVLVGLEKTAGILVTLVKDGPAAAWEQIKSELTDLKDQLIAQVTQMITTEVVKAAVVKLVSMLNPAGAVIQAIIATYNTITFFIEKINQIAAVVASFIDSIAAIAAGQIDNAAKKVEMTMANTLTVLIAFLAKFAGLGNIPNKVVGIIKKIRAPIDKGLDKIVGWLGNMLKKLKGAIVQAGLPEDPQERLKLGMEKAISAVNLLPGNAIGKALIAPVLVPIKIRYGFQHLESELREGNWWLKGQINPSITIKTSKKAGSTDSITLKPGAWIKSKFVDGMWVAQISSISEKNVTIWYNDERKGREIIEREDFIKRFKAGDISEYDYDKTNREKYLGSNVSRDVLLAQYKAEGTHYQKVGGDERVQYPKAKGARWYSVSECDASHEPTDAVTYWNRTGYKHGALSSQVRAWMTNPKNYVFEPASSNRSRGSRRGETYRPPAKA